MKKTYNFIEAINRSLVDGNKYRITSNMYRGCSILALSQSIDGVKFYDPNDAKMEFTADSCIFNATFEVVEKQITITRQELMDILINRISCNKSVDEVVDKLFL